eukprot:g3379.t1
MAAPTKPTGRLSTTRQQRPTTATITSSGSVPGATHIPEAFRSHATHHATSPSKHGRHSSAAGRGLDGGRLGTEENGDGNLRPEAERGSPRRPNQPERSKETLRPPEDGGGGEGEVSLDRDIGDRGGGGGERAVEGRRRQISSQPLGEEARQLLAIEDQLRRLQATMQDHQQQQRQQHQQQQQQQRRRQQQPPIHVSVERPPLLSVLSSAAGPVLTVRAESAATAATIQTQTEVHQAPSLLLGEAASEADEAKTGQERASSAGDSRASTVEASTNTSFSLLVPDGSSLRAFAADGTCARIKTGTPENAVGWAQPETQAGRRSQAGAQEQEYQCGDADGDNDDAWTASPSGRRRATPTPDRGNELLAGAAPSWSLREAARQYGNANSSGGGTRRAETAAVT